MLLRPGGLKGICVWGTLMVLIVVLGPQGAAISKSTLEASTSSSTEAFSVLQLVCVSIGIFAGSLLAVESRQWRTFFLGLLGLAGIFCVIAALVSYYIAFPGIELLLAPAATGLAMGIVFIGSWWWGHRQGYTHALYVALLRPNKYDQEFCDLILNYENAEQSLGFWKTLSYRASAARYRRLRRRPEINRIYDLLVKDVLLDAQSEREIRLKRDKHRKLQALLEEVNAEYPLPPPVPASTFASRRSVSKGSSSRRPPRR